MSPLCTHLHVRPSGRRMPVPQRALDDLRLANAPAGLHRFYHGLLTLRSHLATAPADPARLRPWLYLPGEAISEAAISAQLDALQSLGIIQRYQHHGEQRCHLLAIRVSHPRNPAKIPSPRAGDALHQPDQARDAQPPIVENFPVIIALPANANPHFTPAPTLDAERREQLSDLARAGYPEPQRAPRFLLVLKLFFLLSQAKADWSAHVAHLHANIGPSHDPAAAHQALLTRSPADFLAAHLPPDDPDADYTARLCNLLSRALRTHLEAQYLYTCAKSLRPSRHG